MCVCVCACVRACVRARVCTLRTCVHICLVSMQCVRNLQNINLSMSDIHKAVVVSCKHTFTIPVFIFCVSCIAIAHVSRCLVFACRIYGTRIGWKTFVYICTPLNRTHQCTYLQPNHRLNRELYATLNMGRIN